MLIFNRGNTVPGWYCRYPSTENNKAANMADGEARSRSRVKNKRVARDFSDAEVIRLVEDEEFSVWCDKNLSDDSLDEDDDEGDESQRESGHVVDKISYLQITHNFPLCSINS